ncbi:MAG: hypothetical protein ACRDRN_17685 [Sciscionella sp.]
MSRESMADAASRYRRTLDWRAGYSTHAVWVRTGHNCEAIAVPREVGEFMLRVLAHPAGVLRWPGPPQRWHFCCRPAGDARLPPWLQQSRFRHLRHGALLFLPPSNGSDSPLHWICPPLLPLISFSELCVAVAESLAAS